MIIREVKFNLRDGYRAFVRRCEDLFTVEICLDNDVEFRTKLSISYINDDLDIYFRVLEFALSSTEYTTEGAEYVAEEFI